MHISFANPKRKIAFYFLFPKMKNIPLLSKTETSPNAKGYIVRSVERFEWPPVQGGPADAKIQEMATSVGICLKKMMNAVDGRVGGHGAGSMVVCWCGRPLTLSPIGAWLWLVHIYRCCDGECQLRERTSCKGAAFHRKQKGWCQRDKTEASCRSCSGKVKIRQRKTLTGCSWLGGDP